MWEVEGDSGVHQAFGTLVTQGFFPSSVSERSRSQFCTGPLHRREQGRELLNLGENTFPFGLSVLKVETAEGFFPSS